jgi:LuxR family transcriptional regulator, maltose regulon positive regulatory protein
MASMARSSFDAGETALLATKLAVPRVARGLIARPVLTRRLDAAVGRGLILVTAPPGFGKTTLLASWLSQTLKHSSIQASEQPANPEAQLPAQTLKRSNAEALRAAWLSLDEADDDLARFLSYLVAALRTAAPEVGAATLVQLRSPQPLASEALLVPLLNDIAAHEGALILVLEDYYLISAEPVRQAVAFLLERRPPNLTLVITSRETPALPLARLRARGELLEIGQSDLRFDREQAAAFLRDAMGIDISPAVVAALEARTEGWVAGLQLAALSLRDGDDGQRLLDAFTGGHRFVFEYLSDEVLRGQPPEIQTFLLRTSILGRLSGPLCAAVVEEPPDPGNGQVLLDDLRRRNLFVVPLDDEGRWFRYHQLFADTLRLRLRQSDPELEPLLHRRAAAWYAARGLLVEAIGHRLAAADWEEAAALIEREARVLLVRGEVATLLGWARALPPPLLTARPDLGLVYAWALVAAGQFDLAEAHLGRLELALPAVASDDQRGELLAVRATVAGLRRDRPDATIVLANRALALLSDAKLYVRGVVALILGAAYYQRDEIDLASTAFAEAHEVSVASENMLSALFALRQLAEIEMLRGHLHRASTLLRQAVTLAEREAGASGGATQPPAAGAAYVGLGVLLTEWNDLDAAAEAVRRGIALGEESATVEIMLRGYAGLVAVQQARGEAEAAHATLERAVRIAGETGVPQLLSWIEQIQARFWLSQGDVEAAVAWARRQGFGPDDELLLLQEDSFKTLIRVRLAQASQQQRPALLDDAARLAERLLAQAERAGRTGSAIEILALQALLLDAQGQRSRALVVLERALELARPEGYLRLFLDEGPPMAALLRQLPARSPLTAYLRALLAAQEGGRALAPQRPDIPARAASPQLSPADRDQANLALIEPLSEREREVLALIAAGLTNQEIAERLVVALSTVKKHINSIYGKLDVRSRTQSLLRARELGLLP